MLISKSKLKNQVVGELDNELSLVFKLAIRNTFANKRRNMVIFSIFTSVIVLLYLLLAFSNGAVSNFRNGFQALDNPRSDIVATQVGYAELYRTNSNSDKLKDIVIPNSDNIIEELGELEYVKYIYKKTIPVSLNIYYNDSTFEKLSFRGVDPSMYRYLLRNIEIVEGRMIDPEEENAILLNAVNKEELKAEVGDKVVVLGSNLYNHAVAEEFTVVGYYKAKIDNPFFTTLVFTDLTGYNTISGYSEDEINFLNVDIKGGDSISASIAKLEEWAMENDLQIEFSRFSELTIHNDGMYAVAKMMTLVLTYLVIIFVMIGIINMILVNLYDRRKEIGTYYCIGAEKTLLIQVYSLEILLINIAATVVGAFVGILLQTIINSMKISTSNPGLQLVFGGNVFFMEFNITSVIMLLISVVVITLVISLIALRSSLKVPPKVALLETDE